MHVCVGCDECGNATSDKSYLKRHIEAVHENLRIMSVESVDMLPRTSGS